MIKALEQLPEHEKSELKALLETCQERDGLPVNIQIDKTLNHNKNMKNWFLAYDDEVLIGALSVFQPLKSEAEFTGCTHPDFRTKGIFSTLVAVGIHELKSFDTERLLFLMDRRSESGLGVMNKWGYPLVQTEYSMIFPDDAVVDGVKSHLHIMRTGLAELDHMAQISAAAFEEPLSASTLIILNGLKSKEREQYGAYVGNSMVGIVSVFIQDNTAMINGLAIRPQDQGKGYGKDFLAQLLRMLRRRELQITLDVDSSNGTAYSLYKSMGFKETEIQDYYEKMIV